MARTLWNRLRPGRVTFRSLCRSGDRARDARRWAEAARHYARALDLQPGAASIWVQLGHAEKELARLDAAEAAYLRAKAIIPDDADLLVQLGHFYKARGQTAAAAQHYRQARALGSTDRNMAHFLGDVGDRAAAVRARRSGPALPVIYLDYSDLVLYFRNNRFPTGIQRVQIELFKASMEWDGPAEIRGCAYSHPAQFWVDVEPVQFRRLCELASSPGGVDDPSWRGAVDEFIRGVETRAPAAMPHGATVVNVGTSWWMPDYMALVREAKAKYGVRYAPFVHDLIPMITPEYLDGNLASVFSHWISSVYLHADAIAVNSRCTQRDVMRAAGAIRALAHEPVVATLDAEFAPQGGAPPDAAERGLVLQRLGLVSGRFVLFVGTLEARKNHQLVFQAWSQLLREEGPDRVPVLVCVGKPGWRFDVAHHYLNTHAELADKVVLLSGISDAELRSLFLECLFTVYASFYEGWGLPVTESLAHGKVCLTADHSSLPEAGGKFADYYSDNALPGLVAGARRLILDPKYRAGREALIAAEFRPRGWAEVLATMVDGLLPRLTAPPAPESYAAPIELGTIYRIAHDPHRTLPDRAVAVAEMLRAEQGWHEVEGWGSWAKRKAARLAFLAPDLQGDAAALHLRVRAAGELVLTVRIGGLPPLRAALLPNEQRTLRLDVPRSALAAARLPDGRVVLQLDVDRMHPHRVCGEAKPVGIGVAFLSLCDATDAEARLRVMEEAVLTHCAAPPAATPFTAQPA